MQYSLHNLYIHDVQSYGVTAEPSYVVNAHSLSSSPSDVTKPHMRLSGCTCSEQCSAVQCSAVQCSAISMFRAEPDGAILEHAHALVLRMSAV